jgi:hypothetical protein
VGLQETADSGNLSFLPLFLNSVKLAFILAAILLGSPQSASDQPYELKGEAPGMTLKHFRSDHKRVDCSKRSAALTSCRVTDGVSFAGVPAYTARGCSECAFQGIFADFVHDRMVSLRYGVSLGGAKKIIVALKTKYGEPIRSTETTATWRNSVGYLMVSEDDKFTLITSALNDSGQNKDI